MAKTFWSKIYALWRQPTRPTNLEQGTYLPYFGGNDNFPLEWHDAISKSPSATSCVSTIQDFLEGSGFSDQQLEKKPMNSVGETLFQIHQRAARDFGEFEGFALLVMYNGLGAITEVENLPFENVRLGKPDSSGFIKNIYYNPYFGTKDFKTIRDSTLVYDTFDPKMARAQMINQGLKFKGQVLYVGNTTALSRFYPLPEAYSAIRWMKIETGVSDYHEENINNGFLQPFMLAMIGNPDEPINQPDGATPITRGEAFDNVVSENFMGAKRVGNMWIQWFDQQSELPVPIPFPSNNTGDLFLNVDTQATKKITVAFKVPAILANISEGVSLGGDGNMIRVAVKLMQQRVVKKQRVLTDAYELILKNFDSAYMDEVKIKPYNPYPELEVLDDKIWNAMSAEEQRAWILKNTDVELQSTAPDATPAEPEQPAQPQLPQQAAAVQNLLPIPFPENVRDNIRKVIDYKSKMGITCGGKNGMALSDRIMNNQNLGYKELKRLYNYLKKNERYSNSPYNEGCNVIEYNAWGGKAMQDFLETKITDIESWLN